jgi:hypothetical protein
VSDEVAQQWDEPDEVAPQRNRALQVIPGVGRRFATPALLHYHGVMRENMTTLEEAFARVSNLRYAGRAGTPAPERA